MYEDFPYTNLHELNLDWLVDVVQQLKDNAVISVNGQTGEVVLYQNAVVRLPDVPDADWTLLRSTNGVTRGIKFDRSGNAYIVAGDSLASVFTPENPPASSQITYDQYIRLTTLTDEQMHNWNIFRTLNNQSTGIEFDDTGEAYIISGSNRYRLYSTKNPLPSSGVTSVNGQTGNVMLYSDVIGEITLPSVTNPNIDAWSIGRYVNGTACRIYIYDDGQVIITAGSNEYRLVNSEELEQFQTEIQDDIASAVNTWLTTNITNPNSPPLDRSLSSSAAAAPADIVGNLVNTDLSFLVTVEGKYMNTSGEQSSNILAHTDYIKIPASATKILATSKAYNSAGTNSYKIAPTIVYYDANKSAISAGSTGNTFVVTETQEFPIPDGAVYCIVNQPRYQTVNKRFIQFLTSPIVAHVGSNYSRTALSDSSLTRFLSEQWGIGKVSKPKTIYVHGGTYDIFAEYTALGLLSGNPPANPNTGFWDYNVRIPANTHIIGLGDVVIKWEPESTDISAAWSETISPVNAGGSLILENIVITCKNGRYCIHDDTLGQPAYFGSQKIYRNVICYKKQNDTGYGYSSTIGFGFDARNYYEFDNCSFYNDMGQNTFYGHTRAADTSSVAYGVDNSPRIVIKNCIIDAGAKNNVALSLRNVANAIQHIYTNIISSYIRGWVYLRDESGATGNNTNAYDVTLLNCTKTHSLDLYGENNDYPIKELNPIGDVAE